MIRSMTGYGRSRKMIDGYDVSVEIKSVNNRYCEISVRVPKDMLQLEEAVRAYLKQYINRGKVDVSVSIYSETQDLSLLKLNEPYVQMYLDIFRQMGEKYDIKSDISASVLGRFPNVIVDEHSEVDIGKVQEIVQPVLEEALNAFISQREKEGKYLVDDIILKADQALNNVNSIEQRSDSLVDEYVEKLKQRTAQLFGDGFTIDQQRLYSEIAIMADRMAVDEEIVRFRSHTENLKHLLLSGLKEEGMTPIGKKIDFIIQEMNREINTTTSKISNLEVTNLAIEVKSLVEKIREQVQNIE